MFDIIDYSKWTIFEDAPYGSGASEKHWIKDTFSNEKGVFKYPKVNEYGNITGEYWAEKLASEIAKIVGISAAKVEMGMFNNRRGSLSYLILTKREMLIEGVQFISNKYPNYNTDRLIETDGNLPYSFRMIESVIGGNKEIFYSLLGVVIFDALIGNSDRHHSNWGLIYNVSTENLKLSPIYDNGSSLCCYVNEDDVLDILKDTQRFKALIHTKSKSMIRIGSQKRPRHFKVVFYLKENYYKETINFVENIKNNFTNRKIDLLINRFDDKIISKNMKKLLYRYLKLRREIILSIYEMEDDLNG